MRTRRLGKVYYEHVARLIGNDGLSFNEFYRLAGMYLFSKVTRGGYHCGYLANSE